MFNQSTRLFASLLVLGLAAACSKEQKPLTPAAKNPGGAKPAQKQVQPAEDARAVARKTPGLAALEGTWSNCEQNEETKYQPQDNLTIYYKSIRRTMNVTGSELVLKYEYFAATDCSSQVQHTEEDAFIYKVLGTEAGFDAAKIGYVMDLKQGEPYAEEFVFFDNAASNGKYTQVRFSLENDAQRAYKRADQSVMPSL